MWIRTAGGMFSLYWLDGERKEDVFLSSYST